MLTFFTTAKPFRGHNAIIQRNALKSWTLLRPDVEVILFGDEEGAAKAAGELKIRHETRVERNEFGTNRLDSMFHRTQQIARHETLCYINCDILLMRDFCTALQRVRVAHAHFLMVGRRWDTNVQAPIHFESPDWEARLRARVLLEGKRRTAEWIDYFVFSRGPLGANVPPFAVGRPFWDNWFVWRALDSEYPVIDASAVVLAVHQNQNYGHHPQGKPGVLHGAESCRNSQLAGGWRHLRTIADAMEVLSANGLRPNRTRHWSTAKRYARQAGRTLLYGILQRAWFALLGLTRPLRAELGLRAGFLRRFRERA